LLTYSTAGSLFGMKSTRAKAARLVIWQKTLKQRQFAIILGHPIIEMPAKPGIAANSVPIVFDDSSGYLIIGCADIRSLWAPVIYKSFMEFCTTKHVGGSVVDPTLFRYHRVIA